MTCGTCQWAGRWRPCIDHDGEIAACRRVAWGSLSVVNDNNNVVGQIRLGLTHSDTPACPAYVAKEAE